MLSLLVSCHIIVYTVAQFRQAVTLHCALEPLPPHPLLPHIANLGVYSSLTFKAFHT